MQVKVSDYIVDFLINKGITDVFGYPGGMVTHLMESFSERKDFIHAHVTYNEQGAAFAACGYAQISGKPGVAYATSGPGATNLITGICNAYFDSIPTIFITGQVNTNELKGNFGVRQRGFQETDIVSMVKPVTKWAYQIKSASDVRNCFEKAYDIAMEGRRGPVLLDIPMNIQRASIEMDDLTHENRNGSNADLDDEQSVELIRITLQKELEASSRPCVLLGNGIKSAHCEDKAYTLINNMQIPCVTSMVAFDVLKDSKYNFGFIGAYGDRAANFIVAKCDLLICIGSRLDIRQVGAHRDTFATDAKIIRVDIDRGELTYKTHNNEKQFCISVAEALNALDQSSVCGKWSDWKKVCDQIRTLLVPYKSNDIGNRYMEKISRYFTDNSIITTDVGQNQVWAAQSAHVKRHQKYLFSGGHGAMGYSLPASIGAQIGGNDRYHVVYSLNGDGGLQMNIQELQMIAREQLPIKIIVFNNNALGMIRHFQEMYFEGNYFQTKPEGGYTSPDFNAIASAYGIRSRRITSVEEIDENIFIGCEPELVEVMISENTYVTPKLRFGSPNQDQEPLIDRSLYSQLMNL